MLLTRAADYALRGIAYLARQSPQRLVMASEIAASEDMPEYFFSKIFQNLAKSGLINSYRGSNGGFALAKPAEEITMRDVVEAVEGPLCVTRCVISPEVCEKSNTCPFHIYWKEVQESIESILNKYTLADAVFYMRAIEEEERRSRQIY